MAAVKNSMRYLRFPLLLLLVIFAATAETTPKKRPPGKQSSLRSVRKKQTFNRKPLVYSPKTNRPLVVKKPHWWQRK